MRYHTDLHRGRANGNVAQVIAAYEESAENIEIAETIKVGANTMAAEESVDSSSTEQDSIVNGSMDQHGSAFVPWPARKNRNMKAKGPLRIPGAGQ